MKRDALISYTAYYDDNVLAGRGYVTFHFEGNFTAEPFNKAMQETLRMAQEKNRDVKYIIPDYIYLFEPEQE